MRNRSVFLTVQVFHKIIYETMIVIFGVVVFIFCGGVEGFSELSQFISEEQGTGTLWEGMSIFIPLYVCGGHAQFFHYYVVVWIVSSWSII